MEAGIPAKESLVWSLEKFEVAGGRCMEFFNEV